MDELSKLAKLFAHFPGIGERQAKRFVYFLLSADGYYVNDLADSISEIKKHITRCKKCFRFFKKTESDMCFICNDARRDQTSLMIVEKDADIESMEKSGVYKGLYFVLGGLVPVVEKDTSSRVRINEIEKRVEVDGKAGTLKEIILAFSLSPNGDHTDTYIREVLDKKAESYKMKISSLGRGLSTGTELEYSDRDTLKNALKNRQ
jgi:recombination protein RecR